MATRVLIINRQLVFAVTLKQALEQTGTFDVHPFTTADAAFDYLRDHPQDVALVDFTLPGRSGAKVIQQLRGIQSDLAVIISPRQPDADALMSGLRLQGMIDMPFGARDVIPLIEQALEQLLQTPLDDTAEPESDEPMLGQTRILGDAEPHSQQQFGATRILDGNAPQDKQVDQPGQTRNLDQAQDRELPNPYQTRNLNESPAQTRDLSGDDVPQNLYKTRNLDDDSPVPPPATPYPAQTRNLDEDAPPVKSPRPAYGETRDLSEDEPLPPAQSSRRQPAQTRDLDPRMQEPPPAPPEISSLESVLRSFGFDPPLGEEDTPAVPMSDNEALRQFLATADGPVNSEQFDDVLGAINPDEHGEPNRQESDFDALVKSMKSGETQRGLPDRQQQLLDFVFTSGMDSVLKEIEKTKTGPLPEQPTTIPEQPRERGKKGSFQKLAKEEPPMPSLEEGGTVSDLMLGVSDRGFRNVLSLLRGDEPDENEPSEKLPPPRLERHERFADFFNPVTGPQVLGDEPEDAAQVPSVPVRSPQPSPEPDTDSYDFDNLPEADEEATVAQVILKTALEDLNLPEGFSLNQLLTDIENRLSLHKLNVKPLPSWQMDTGAFRPVTETEIREPDFLPEEMPPGEVVDESSALEFEEPENITGHTTRPSLASQQTLGVFPEDADTLFDAKFIKSTMAPPPYAEEEPDVEPEPDSLPDWPAAEEIVVPESFVEPQAAVLPEWLPDEAPAPVEADTEGFPIEHLPEETTPSLAFTNESGTIPESETVLSGDTWDIRIIPDDEEQPVWDEAPADGEIESFSEEHAEFEAALDGWSLQPETQDASGDWDTPPPVEESVDEWSQQPETQDAGDQWSAQAAEEILNETEDMPTDFYAEAVPADVSWDLPVEESGIDEEVVPEDPYIAQLALNLTQFSLESSSEGSLLTRGDEVVAYAGHLSDEDAAELRDAVNNDWDANPQGARVRFITLPSSRKDYMLYSIRTDEGLTLSMIFAGTTPLRVIRQQGQKLIAALESIPDVPVEEAPAPEIVEPEAVPQDAALVPVVPLVDEALLNPYTYVWLLRDADGQINEAVAQAMMSGLKIQLRELGWSIRTLQVHEDFVYLFAGVPGDTPPHEIMRDLKRRSAEIAHAQNSDITPQMLWADAYLILTPGRELETEEILEFVNFQRMA